MPGILWAVIQEPLELPRRFNNGQPHHCTLLYGCSNKLAERYIGLPLSLPIVSECWNDRIQAVQVIVPAGIPFDTNRPNPHVTVSYADGVQPVESNAMLAGEHQESEVKLDRIITTIEFLDWGTIDPLCPHCGSDCSVSYGKNRHGNARRRCQDCRKVWTV